MKLSDLPSDIMRIIVTSTQESFDSMRLISYRWRDLCQDYLNDHKKLPVINCFSWEIISENRTKLIAHIHEKNRRYFGIENWCHYGREESLICYCYTSWNESDPILSDRLSRLFNRCSRIKLLYWMCHSQDVNPFGLICNSLRNVNVDKLSLEFERNTSKGAILQLLDIVRNNKVQNVYIATCDINGFINMGTVNVLCDIARAGSAILINAQYWERDPTKSLLCLTSWDGFYQLMNREEGIAANLQQFSTGKYQFSISIVAKK